MSECSHCAAARRALSDARVAVQSGQLTNAAASLMTAASHVGEKAADALRIRALTAKR